MWIVTGTMNTNEKKKVLASVVSALVEIVMTNHPVTCAGRTAVQKEGGAIGLALTCDVAKSVMMALDSPKVVLGKNQK